MNRNTPLLTACILVLLVGTPHGAALHCNGNIITIDAGAETFYIDDRSDQAGEIDHWFYQEANGREGLQTGAPCGFHSCDPPLGYGDVCWHDAPDLLVS